MYKPDDFDSCIMHDETNHNAFEKLKNKEIRKHIAERKEYSPKCKKLWENKLNIDVSRYFSVAHLTTKEGKLRSFQYKILHHIYTTNILLSKMGIKNQDTCSFCNEQDTLPHFFYGCSSLFTFWQHIENLISIILHERIEIDTKIALFGITKYDIEASTASLKEVNLLIILAKLCISKNRYINNPKTLHFILEHELLLREKSFTILNEKLNSKSYQPKN